MQRETTPATVKSLTLKDVKDYYNHVYRPDLCTIVIIGNIEPDDAKQAVEKYFGSWKADGEKPATEFNRVPLNKPSVASVPDKSRVQDKVILSQTLNIVRSNPDYYALELGNHILGGSFYATRLYKDLRENSGLVYFVSSSFSIGKNRSKYTVNYGCDPPNVSKARSVIERDLKQMQDSLVTARELKQAQSMLLREIPLSESSLGSIARGLLSRSGEDLPLNEPTLAARKYLKLTPEEIKAAFAKWIRPSAFVQVSEGPEPK